MSTARRLVQAAAELLDDGGPTAVTTRAVATAIGVSHNAPYKHFASRDALLAAVAAADFAAIADTWSEIRASPDPPADRLVEALDVVIRFSEEHPARYRLLFGYPEPAAPADALADVAETALGVFSDIVAGCQEAGFLPRSPSDNLGIVLFAAVHGLIDADVGGRLRSRSGWSGVRAGMTFLIGVLGQHDAATTGEPTAAPARALR